MSDWVRDYLFMPLGGFRPRNLWHHVRVTMITMTLVGLWHGAQWTFVLWGFCHGVALIVYHMLHMYVLRKHRHNPMRSSLPWRFGSWALTQAWFVAVIIPFFSPDLGRLGVFLGRLFNDIHLRSFGQLHIIFGLLLCAGFFAFHYVQHRSKPEARVDRLPPSLRALSYATLVFVILFGAVGSAEEFIYFQF
jgi:alginate O-acetyltransferase complex protein AlgI